MDTNNEVDDELKSLIVNVFTFDDSEVEIYLESHSDHHEYYVILARWQGGGLVNGYQYHIDNIGSLTLQEAASIAPIKRLIKHAREDVKSRSWQQYEKMLKDSNHLT